MGKKIFKNEKYFKVDKHIKLPVIIRKKNITEGVINSWYEL